MNTKITKEKIKNFLFSIGYGTGTRSKDRQVALKCNKDYISVGCAYVPENDYEMILGYFEDLSDEIGWALKEYDSIIGEKTIRLDNVTSVSKDKHNINELEPTEYFNYLKSHVCTITDEELANFYNGSLLLVEKYKTTGQKRIIEKLRFLIDCVEKERAIVKMGINSFVYRDDIEEYIDNIAKNTVKIIELENYPRDIPDDIVEIIGKTKGIFDKFYVVFTDYTGKVERTIEKERRDKDPILFGTFQKTRERNNGNILNDRFYYLGDWEDEFCDLTMDKFLREVGQEKLQIIGTPTNVDEIRQELNSLDDSFRRINDINTIFDNINENPKKGLLSRIKGKFGKK